MKIHENTTVTVILLIYTILFLFICLSTLCQIVKGWISRYQGLLPGPPYHEDAPRPLLDPTWDPPGAPSPTIFVGRNNSTVIGGEITPVTKPFLMLAIGKGPNFLTRLV